MRAHAVGFEAPPDARVRATPTCHPDRRHAAHGLCLMCYKRTRRPERVSAMPPAADVLAQRARRQVANAADWRRRNPGRDKELRRSYYQRHKDAYRGYVLTRRARQAAAPVNDFTGEQWQELLVEHASTCAYCLAHGVPLEADHSVPLSRGGSHTKANIVPACRSCNSRKGDKTPAEFFAWLQARRQAAAA